MNVIISIGGGRLHFINSVRYILRAGVDVRLILGWVPKNSNGILVKLASILVRRDLSKSFESRRVQNEGVGRIELRTQETIDFFENFLRWFLRLIKAPFFVWQGCQTFCWRLIGLFSCRYIDKRFSIFHVRSGAGHGGAIKRAKQLGLSVLVDHSIAHPAYMEKHLRPEYEKNGAVFDLGTSSPFWKMIVEDCEWADALLVNSFFVRDTFIEQGYRAEKIKVVYLGTRPDFFGLRKVQAANRGERKLRLLFTGGFGFRKGAEYILDAVRILMEKATVPFEMDVVGDYSGAKVLIEKFNNHVEQVDRVEGGEMDGCAGASTCSTRSAWLNKSPITFHGPVPQDDLKKFLAQSDIYVFPSLAEGCACSGMEAMAAGLCVVATHEAGFPIEDGVNGCVVPGKNAEAVAEKIMWLMGHPDEIDRMGAAAAELIRTKYTWEQYAENVKKIYEDLLGKNSRVDRVG